MELKEKTAFLHLLLRADGNRASEAYLLQALGLSQVGLQECLHQLLDEGVVLKRAGDVIKLCGLPKELNASVLEAFLFPETRWIYCKSIDSTNTEAQRMLCSGKEAPFAVVARKQTAGRGRLGRRWFSEDTGNIYLSFGFRPLLTLQQMQGFTLWMGLAFCRLLNASYGLPLQVKWPNDLLCEGKKVAGILTESRLEGCGLKEVILGIGVNVNSLPQNLAEPGLRFKAGSLAESLGKDLELNGVCALLIKKGFEYYEAYLQKPELDAQFLAEWARYDALQGRRVCIRSGEKTISGIVLGIAPKGSLLVLQADGTQEEVYGGEATLVE